MLRSLLLLTSLSSAAFAIVPAYKAEIKELGGSSVWGIAVVFTNQETIVGYAGYGTGLEANLGAAECTATNGCGAHIHSGFDCTDRTSQGGHYYVDPVSSDPWVEERYTSASDGAAVFNGIVDIGSARKSGRTFEFGDWCTAKIL